MYTLIHKTLSKFNTNLPVGVQQPEAHVPEGDSGRGAHAGPAHQPAE